MNIKFFALLIAAATFGFSACGGNTSNSNLAGKAANATNTVIKETSNLANSTGNAVNSMVKEISTNTNTANKTGVTNTAGSKMTNTGKSANHSERDGDK